MTDETPELIVVRDERPNIQVAKEIVKFLADNPDKNTVQEIAEGIEAPEEQVTLILHNYRPDKTKGAKLVGEGKGGEWLPEHIAKQYRNRIS